MIFDSDLVGYDFGVDHPMSPVRVDLTMRLAIELGVVATPGSPAGSAVGARAATPVIGAAPAGDDLLASVHDASYIEAVRRAGRLASKGRWGAELAYGLGTEDNPLFPGMHEVSAHIVGATVEAARQVWTGQVRHAANVTGGLHHAMPDRASGFCIYNDLAVAIRWLLDHGARRVAYVDVDVHHGDGVQSTFYDDPRVLTVSLHETGRVLFPGTGFPQESGGPQAPGSVVNVALPPGTSDAGWLRAFHAVVPPVLRAFEPDILVTQHGCDTHIEDPLAHLMLTVDGQRASYLALHELAHDVCQGRWLATGGGGYAVVDVVPRAWTHLLAIVGGRPLEPTLEVPEAWRDHVRSRLGRIGPSRLTDGRAPRYKDWSEGFDPDTALDRAILATRTRVFPEVGLDPLG